MSMSLDGYIAGPNDEPDNPGGITSDLGSLTIDLRPANYAYAMSKRR
jgi:hypothetical protein